MALVGTVGAQLKTSLCSGGAEKLPVTVVTTIYDMTRGNTAMCAVFNYDAQGKKDNF